MALFRLLDGNVRAEVEHHNTRYKKDLCKRYQDNVTASGLDEIARVVKKVMGLEDSKWREAVTAQTKAAKTNVGSRVQEMTRFENTLQLDFQASMRLTTCNFYPTMSGKGLCVYADSSGMFVCVYWGGSIMYVLTLPVRFRTCVSSRYSLEVRFKWIHYDISEVSTRNEMSHPNYMGLVVQPWPPPPQVEIDELQVPHAYAQDESLWLAELWCEFLV